MLFGKGKTKDAKDPGGGDQGKADLERLESGIPRLDYILKGGFLKGGTYAVMGPPGGGKTILASQLCFNAIRLHGAQAVYVSLMVESVSKMFTHLRSMSFFDESAVHDRLYFISAYSAMKDEGIGGFLDVVRHAVKDRQPAVLVIDGLHTVRRVAKSDLEFEECVHQLQAFTGLLGCTTLLLSTYLAGYTHTENVLVDGVLELSDKLVGPRAVRELTVHKFRGSDCLRGRHEVEITDDGVQIHPRTEIQFSNPPGSATESRTRVGFGIGQLDAMMQGGPLTGSATALVGAPGTGKTLLGLHYLCEGARQGHRGIYFGFYEPPPRLVEKAEQVGLPLEKYCKKGLIEVIWQPPLEHYMDSLAEQLLEKLRQDSGHYDGKRRLFIDGIEGFRSAAVYQERVPRFLSAFTNQLRMLDVTTLISEELGLFKQEIEMPSPELANVVETVILLRYTEYRSHLHRLVSIMKMRESIYDTSIREFKLGAKGIDVADSFKSAEAILSGHARERGRP